MCLMGVKMQAKSPADSVHRKHELVSCLHLGPGPDCLAVETGVLQSVVLLVPRCGGQCTMVPFVLVPCSAQSSPALFLFLSLLPPYPTSRVGLVLVVLLKDLLEAANLSLLR